MEEESRRIGERHGTKCSGQRPIKLGTDRMAGLLMQPAIYGRESVVSEIAEPIIRDI